ncbi:hypothetical protein [Microbacterium sp. cf332]|uniref:hypothetical protein n=1 Tax=Microbacterium sp. cf332 TaxID=1761804 RepID=UPI000890BF5C|nr:hypothetical protein [Microbacterium sp. cf332]SDQ46519.1 hypothetical protein SAMN04487847_1513 [Microbacterium sp. cf332]
MSVRGDEQIAAMRRSFDVLGGVGFSVEAVMDVDRLTDTGLALGVMLGLIDAPSHTRLRSRLNELGRGADPIAFPRSERPEWGETDDGSRRIEVDEILADSAAMTFWFVAVMRLLVSRWSRGTGDPRIDDAEIISAWGQVGDDFWSVVRPRGWDALFFGHAARRRYIEKARAYLDRLSPQKA